MTEPTERERAMLDAADKFEELRGDAHELYGWLRGQAKGIASTQLWAEICSRRRRTMPTSSLDDVGIARRAQEASIEITPRSCHCGDPECCLVEDTPVTASAETVQGLLGDIRALSAEVSRLRVSESRAHQAAMAAEEHTNFIRDRVLEFFRRCIAPNAERHTMEFKPYGIHQFSVDAHVASVSRGDAVGYALLKWWRQLTEPHDFPEKQRLPSLRE